MNELLKLFIPISLMSDGDLKDLLEEVELAEAHPQMKSMATQMLADLLPGTQKDWGAHLAKRIGNGDFPLTLTSDLSEWAREDLAGALAWFQASQKDGTLFGKGTQSAEPELGAVLAGELAKKNPEQAFALMDTVEPSARATVLAGIAGVLAGRGEQGWGQLVERIGAIENIDSAIKVVDAAVTTMAQRGQRTEVLSFLESIEVDPKVERLALARVVASAQSGESISQRMSWLQEHTGDQSYPETVKDAVQQLYRNEPVEVRNWIDALPRGGLRDAALASESSAMSFGPEWEEAFERVDLIGDDVVREKQRELLKKQTKFREPFSDHPAALHKKQEGSR